MSTEKPTPHHTETATSPGETVAGQLRTQQRLDRETTAHPASDAIIDHMLKSTMAGIAQDREKGYKPNIAERLLLCDTETRRPFEIAPMSESMDRLAEGARTYGQAWRESDLARGIRTDRAGQAWQMTRELIKRAILARNNGDVRPESADVFAELLAGGLNPPNAANYIESKRYYRLYCTSLEARRDTLTDAELSKRYANHDAVKSLVAARRQGRPTEDQSGHFIHFYGQGDVNTVTERLYIGLAVDGNPQAGLAAWFQAIDECGLDGKLYFKVTNGVDERADSIVAYPTDAVDREQLVRAVVRFRELAPKDSLLEHASQTGNEVGRGMSFGLEYQDLNMIARSQRDGNEGTSFGANIAAFSQAAFQLAYRRCYKAQAGTGQLCVTEIVQEAKVYMRELLQLAGINPETMVPYSQNEGKIPAWVSRLRAAVQ